MIFRTTWVFTEFTHRLKRVGDMLPVTGELKFGARANWKLAMGNFIVICNRRELNYEDIDVIERMQSERLSEGLDGGVLSPYREPVHRQFEQLVTDALGGEQPG